MQLALFPCLCTFLQVQRLCSACARIPWRSEGLEAMQPSPQDAPARDVMEALDDHILLLRQDLLDVPVVVTRHGREPP